MFTPLEGIELSHPAPEAGALSTELQGHSLILPLFPGDFKSREHFLIREFRFKSFTSWVIILTNLFSFALNVLSTD